MGLVSVGSGMTGSGQDRRLAAVLGEVYPTLVRAVAAYVSSPEVAQDIAQDAMLRAWERRDVADAVPAGADAIISGLSVNCGACSMPPLPETTAIYHPATNTWTPAPTNPIAEANHLGFVWTGNAVVSLNSAAIAGAVSPGDATAYSPSGARWVALRPAPFGCANSADLVWTGKQILMYCSRPSHGAAAGHDGLALTPAGTEAVGELSGTLTLSGLANNGKPLDGLITATGPGGKYHAVVHHGRFGIALPPGTYTVTGTSPTFNRGKGTCNIVGGSVNIHPGHTTSAHVECAEK